MQKGKVQIYYGEGQGKSSAAIGNAIKGAIDGESTYIIQFLKGMHSSDYLTKLEPEIKVFRFEKSSESFDQRSVGEREDDRENIKNGLNFAKKTLCSTQCDILVLDEVLGLIDEGMASEDEIIDLLNARTPYTTVIMTGRKKLPKIFDLADEVLQIMPEK